VKSSLTCGCDQFANPDNVEALAELTRLKKEATGCTAICPAIACLPAGEGTCESDAPNEDAGHCASVGAILQ
jgi:hypothetical protein